MMRRWWLYILAIGMTLLPVSTPLTTRADEPSLIIDIDPQSGPPDTTVTISGHGAPANAMVVVLFSPWDAAIRCDDGRDAAPVAEVMTDAEGTFSATHEAKQFTSDQVGYTYLAKLVAPGAETPESVSNVECFAFGSDPRSCFGPENKDFKEYREPQGRVPIFGYPISEGSTKPKQSSPIEHVERSAWPTGTALLNNIQIRRSDSELGTHGSLRQSIAQHEAGCGVSNTPFQQADCQFHRPPAHPKTSESSWRWSPGVYTPPNLISAGARCHWT